ncbi:MAG: hypothetical protein KIT72_16285 [Polyangiaceae bacterium]|nr:hypothetical protein [Polyangiaceae bacterium]MCW5791977.1 hypothetical protein [Polyangiaceae bacterium]
MKDDLLKEATRALREVGDRAAASELTRARVLREVQGARRARGRRLAVGVPLAAVFVASAAAAQVSGVLPQVAQRALSALGVTSAEAPQVDPGAGAQPRVTPGATQPPDPLGAAPADEDPSPEDETPGAADGVDTLPDDKARADSDTSADDLAEAPSGDPQAPEGGRHRGLPLPGHHAPSAGELSGAAKVASAKAPAGKAPSPTGAPAAKEGEADDSAKRMAGTETPDPDSVSEADLAHQRYLAAHRAHFGAQDHARALALWDAYLKEHPRGRFATEAAYNRALCLVRLGRHAEARAALTPFAEGRYGGYRQAEAAALLTALK